MPQFSDHPIFAWLGQPALGLDIYAQAFDGASVEIMGESPYLNAKGAGISFALSPDHSVRAAFLYHQDVEGFAAYQGSLPKGLTLAHSRADVRAALGEPAMSMDAGGVGLMAIDFAFDRFEEADIYLRCEYLPGDNAIRLITIGRSDD
jgi:hypothetical protein